MRFARFAKPHLSEPIRSCNESVYSDPNYHVPKELSEEERVALGKRVRVLVEAVGTTQAAAAEIAGVSVQQLGRVMRAKNAPSLVPLARLAEATGISLDWVATGEGPQRRGDPESVRPREVPAPTDPELFGRLVDGIGRAYRDAGVRLPPIELGRIAAEEYDTIASAISDPEERRIAARLTAERIRRELRDDDRARSTRKRGA